MTLPLFRRFATNQTMPVPVRGGSIEEIRSFVRVREEGKWRLLIVWVIASFIPDIPHPILMIYGEQGSAKSSQARMLARLIDPSNPLAKGIPKDLISWVQTADHNWLILLDNLSEIKPWLSDALCRAVTGEGFSKRKLYTDGDDVILSFRRAVITTSIEVPANRSDLLDRALLLEMLPILPGERVAESDYEAKFLEAWPRLLGAILDVLVLVLRELPNVHAENLPRMADFARVGIAVERVLGWPEGSFFSAYATNMDGQHQEALDASPIGGAVIKLMRKQAEWRGSAEGLLTQLNKDRTMAETFMPEWPKHPNQLGNLLRRVAPNLRFVGVEIEFFRSNGKREIKLERNSQWQNEAPVLSEAEAAATFEASVRLLIGDSDF